MSSKNYHFSSTKKKKKDNIQESNYQTTNNQNQDFIFYDQIYSLYDYKNENEKSYCSDNEVSSNDQQNPTSDKNNIRKDSFESRYFDFDYPIKKNNQPSYKSSDHSLKHYQNTQKILNKKDKYEDFKKVSNVISNTEDLSSDFKIVSSDTKKKNFHAPYPMNDIFDLNYFNDDKNNNSMDSNVNQKKSLNFEPGNQNFGNDIFFQKLNLNSDKPINDFDFKNDLSLNKNVIQNNQQTNSLVNDKNDVLINKHKLDFDLRMQILDSELYHNKIMTNKNETDDKKLTTSTNNSNTHSKNLISLLDSPINNDNDTIDTNKQIREKKCYLNTESQPDSSNNLNVRRSYTNDFNPINFSHTNEAYQDSIMNPLPKLCSLSMKVGNRVQSLKPKFFSSKNPINSNLNDNLRSFQPALLSKVAEAFKKHIILKINTKDGLQYYDTFTGKNAVDLLCKIISTNDRNLASLAGRSLDAQKFFHDVTYNHRLRDSDNEVYAFSHSYGTATYYQEDNEILSNSNQLMTGSHNINIDKNANNFSSCYSTSRSDSHSVSSLNFNNNDLITLKSLQESNFFFQNIPNNNIYSKNCSSFDFQNINGVLILLTDCYSPTCTRNRLCYSVTCPKRLEQQLHYRSSYNLKKSISHVSLNEKKTDKFWHETVSQDVLNELDAQEKLRQELIYEFVYTEKDYSNDLDFMTEYYVLPLKNPFNNIIPENQRENFINIVFGGLSDLLKLAKNFSETLNRRQLQQKPVIETFGDLFLDFVKDFDPFVQYSGNKVFATFEHERQQQVNPRYVKFLEIIEKKPESRKQNLSSFLIKGIQRPSRYQLLLNGIIKNTKKTSKDYPDLLKAKEKIEILLNKINLQTGKSTDRHKIMVLNRLIGKQSLEKFNFKLNYSFKINYQTTLYRKKDGEKITVYLFEHAILMIRHKIQNKREHHRVFEKPIYFSLLFVNGGSESLSFKSILNNRYKHSLLSDAIIRNKSEYNNYVLNSNSTTKFQINFFGLGNLQVNTSLICDDATLQKHFLNQVSNQQKKLIDSNDFFTIVKYETKKFSRNNKIICAVFCYGGKKLLYGTDFGVWISTVREISNRSNEKVCSDPTLVISKNFVSQIEVLKECSKLLVLAEKILYEFDLSCIDSLDYIKNTKSAKLILTNILFFKIGVCDGKLLVCSAKTGSINSIFIFEPLIMFDKLNTIYSKNINIQEIQFTSQPVSISFLKTKLCIGCIKGFEILSLEKNKKEPILDKADSSLDFAIQREVVTPLAIHRMGRVFLLCYAEFVFLINRNGWRIGHEWILYWEGTPHQIILFYPYILSFDSNFIEIRDLITRSLLRVLVAENIRFMHANKHEAMYACEENGYDVIVTIDFLNLKP